MTKPYNIQSERYKRVTCSLAIFIAAGNVANTVVECEEFRDLVKELDERYPIPGRTAIGTQMDQVLVDLKAKMEVVLKERP